jgi:D-arginine dehydrogenase
MKPELVIVGGGIAGISCAARAVADFSVTVLEAEMQPGYHSSGRSAAVSIEAYMNPVVHALTLESSAYHRAMGARPTRCCEVADASHAHLVDEFIASWQGLCPDLHEISPAEMRAAVPILGADVVHRVVVDPNALALDPHGLLEGFRRMLVAGGGRVVGNARVSELEAVPGGWRVRCGNKDLQADILVNAAGAWADGLALLAGARPLGLQPLRRTAVLVDPAQDVSAWPLVHRAQGGLYFKPEAGLLMVSLGDETPSPPCDAQPEELDIAMTLARFQQMTTLVDSRPVRSWAGLRTFLPDRFPAVGFDAKVKDFFWLVGQGGYGMQTAPALSQIAVDLLAGRVSRFTETLSPSRAFTGPGV